MRYQSTKASTPSPRGGSRPVARQLDEKLRVGEGDRHVALLHVDEIARRAQPGRRLDRSDEVHQSDRLLRADIDDAPGRDRRQAVVRQLRATSRRRRKRRAPVRQQPRHGFDEIGRQR